MSVAKSLVVDLRPAAKVDQNARCR